MILGSISGRFEIQMWLTFTQVAKMASMLTVFKNRAPSV